MGKKMKIKRLFAIVIASMLMANSVDCMTFAAGDNGSLDANFKTGTTYTVSDSLTFEEALKQAADGDIIDISNGASVLTTAGEELLPLIIDKSVTITGGELAIRKAGVLLEADVTFKNMNLCLANNCRDAVWANGYTLTIDGVNCTSREVDLFGGSLYMIQSSSESILYTGSKGPGNAGKIVIKGTNSGFGNVYAGSMNGVFAGTVSIQLDRNLNNGVGTMVYGSGALESRYNADNFLDPYYQPDAPTASAGAYPVTGTVLVDLTYNSGVVIDGKTGGDENVLVTYTDGGKGYPCMVTLDNIGSLSLNGETDSAPHLILDEKSQIATDTIVNLPSHTRLDMTDFADTYEFTIGMLNGGGTLVLGTQHALTITGEVNGTTSVAIGNVSYDGVSSVGTVYREHKYIKAINSTYDENCSSFVLLPPSGENVDFEKDEDGNWWVPVRKLLKIEKVNIIPKDVVLEEEKASVVEVIDELPIYIEVTLEDEETYELYIDWSCENFSLEEGAINIFTWFVPEYETDGWLDVSEVVLTGTIRVKNPGEASAEVAVVWPVASDLIYGQQLSESTLSGGSIEYGTFSWKDGGIVPEVGRRTYVVVFTPSDEALKNYKGLSVAENEVVVNVAKKGGFTVNPINKKYLYTREYADSVSLGEKLPEDCGNVKYEITSVTGEIVYSKNPFVEKGVLYYTISSGSMEDKGTIQIIAQMDNYEDITFTLNVERTDRIGVDLKEDTEVILEKNELVYGESLSSLAFKSETAEFIDEDGKVVAGTLVWKEPKRKPKAGITQEEWVFTPEKECYAIVSGRVSVCVSPAELTIMGVEVENKTYDGTDIVNIISVALSGVVGEDEVAVNTESLTGRLSGCDAGDYTVVNLSDMILQGADSTNYQLVSATMAVPTQVTITKAKAVITTAYDSYTKVYSDEAFSIAEDITVVGEGRLVYNVSDGLDVEGNFKNATDIVTVSEDGQINVVGSGSVKVSLDMEPTINYEAAETKTIIIQVKPWDDVDRNGFFVKAICEETYQGIAIKPEPKVYDGNGEICLEKGLDYTISYKNNKNAYTIKEGEPGFDARKAPTIIIKGKGNYARNLTVYFTIQPVDISDTMNQSIIAEDVLVEVNGKVQKKTPIVKFQNKKLGKADMVCTYPIDTEGAYKNPGTYSIVIDGKGNFTGSREVDLIVTEKGANLAKAVVKKISSKMFDGVNPVELDDTELVVIGKVKGKNEILKRDVHYTVEYENNATVGTATVILHAIDGGGFKGSKKVSFKVRGESISKANIIGVKNQTYTGSARTLELKVNKGIDLVEGKDYKVSYSNNICVGTAVVTVQGIGRYTGTVKKTFKITPVDISSIIELKDGELITKYVKGGVKPTVNLAFNGKCLNEGKDYIIIYKNNKAVCSSQIESSKKLPTLIIKGKGNFSGTVSRTFIIEGRNFADTELLVTMTAADKVVSAKKGGYISKVVLTDCDGKILKQGKDYSVPVYSMMDEKGELVKLTKTDILPVGTLVIVSVTGLGAYGEGEQKELTTTYRITAKDFTKVKIQSIQKTYTGKSITLTETDFMNANGTSKVTLGREELMYGKDFEVVLGSYKNNRKKGSATVTIRGIGEYGGTKTMKFKIGARNLWFWWL